MTSALRPSTSALEKAQAPTVKSNPKPRNKNLVKLIVTTDSKRSWHTLRPPCATRERVATRLTAVESVGQSRRFAGGFRFRYRRILGSTSKGLAVNGTPKSPRAVSAAHAP